MGKDKTFFLSNEIMALLDLRTGYKLLVGRGSGIGPAFIARAKICNEALKHKELIEY